MPETASNDEMSRLYEQSFSGMEKLRPGQLVETVVLSVAKDSVFLELSGKSEGVLARDEVTDASGNLTVKPGDSLKVYFLRDDRGEKVFTKRFGGESVDTSLLEQAFREKIPVEGVVEKETKGGYEVKIGESRAFCPYSQMGPQRSDNPAEYVGKKLTFRIQEWKENGRNLLVSNRVFHEEARQDKLEELKKSLKEGMKVKGTVLSLQDFGAFVDIGVKALLPVSEISRARVEDIRSVLSVGQEIEAVILKLDWQNEKISVSTKSLQADPWAQAAAKFPEGTKLSGRVVRVSAFGAFVSLEPGIDGLVHVSEFRSDGKYAGGNEVPVKVGQTLAVQVLSADAANRRIALKPATTKEEDETSARYLGGTDGDTYNPFASLLKKK